MNETPVSTMLSESIRVADRLRRVLKWLGTCHIRHDYGKAIKQTAEPSHPTRLIDLSTLV